MELSLSVKLFNGFIFKLEIIEFLKITLKEIFKEKCVIFKDQGAKAREKNN